MSGGKFDTEQGGVWPRAGSDEQRPAPPSFAVAYCSYCDEGFGTMEEWTRHRVRHPAPTAAGEEDLCHVCGHAEHASRACAQCECSKEPATESLPAQDTDDNDWDVDEFIAAAMGLPAPARGSDSARAEAERRYNLNPHAPTGAPYYLIERQAFEAGAEWARAEERRGIRDATYWRARFDVARGELAEERAARASLTGGAEDG